MLSFMDWRLGARYDSEEAILWVWQWPAWVGLITKKSMNMEEECLAALHVKIPDKEEQVIELKDGQSLKVGRDHNNELMVEDVGVSRMHAVFSASSSGLVVADMSSRNGTFLNGERISSLRDLSSGDIVDIGSVKISVQIHSSDLVNSMSSNFASRAMTAELKPVAATVLVLSVADFERISKGVPADSLMPMLQRWHDLVRTVVEALDGTIDKVLGRNIVAIWIGTNGKELAKSAARAAIKIRQVTEQLSKKSEWARHATHPWTCTVVLSSGAGLQGTVGARTESAGKEFTLLGDPINVAFQLEEAISKLGQFFIVPKATAELIGDEFIVRKIIGVNVRGEDKPVEVFAVKY